MSFTGFLPRALVLAAAFVLVLVLQQALPVPDQAIWGDAAADMLLTERAYHGWLLTGHYSRFGFNHPGPFFLYVRHLGDRVTGRFLDPRAQVTALAVVGALFVGIAAAAAAPRETGGAGPWIAGVAALGAVLVQHQVLGLDVLSPSMPSIVVAPFFAYTLTIAHVSRGRLSLLPVATFCGAALVHGYGPTALVVGLSWPLALCIGLRGRRRAGAAATALGATLNGSAAIIAIFAAPIVADFVLHTPGNAVVIAVSTDEARWVPGRLSPALGVVSGPWGELHPSLWIAAGVGFLISWRDTAARAALRHVAAWAVIASLLAAVFLLRVRGDLYPFLIAFSFGGVLALATAAIGAGAAALHALAGRGAVIGVIALAGLVAVTHASNRPVRTRVPPVDTRVLASVIEDDMRRNDAREARIAMRRDSDWPVATGILLELRRRHLGACVSAAHMDFLFTPERICPAGPAARRYEIVAADACRPSCLIQLGRWGLADTGAPGP